MVTSTQEKVVVLPSLKDLIDAAKSPNASSKSHSVSSVASPPKPNLGRYSPVSLCNSPGNVDTPTRANFEHLYENFLKTYHQPHQSCKTSDHLIKFNDPPTYQKKTFFAYDLYLIVVDCGGIHTLQKLTKTWTNTTMSSSNGSRVSTPRNWTQVASLLGYDTKATNISFRIKEWLKYHHIDAFFDYLMGIPNEFYANSPPPQLSSSDTGLRISTTNSYKPAGAISSTNNQQYLKRPLESGPHSPRKMFASQPPFTQNETANSDEESASKEEQDKLSYPAVLPTPMRSASAEEEIASLKRIVANLEERNRHFSEVIDSQRLQIDTLARDLDRQSKVVQHAAKFKEVLFRYSDLLP